MLDAAYRAPPFEAGKKEKGFRDALIAEAFVQLVNSSPVTPSICRVVLVAGDDRLSEAVAKRTKDSQNVRILASVEELGGLINTLASQVSEDVVKEVRGKADACFFEKDNKDGFYYKADIRSKIKEQFEEQLHAKADNADSSKQGTWWITKPDFVRKDGKRFHWNSRITVDLKAIKKQPAQGLRTLAELANAPSASSSGLIGRAILGSGQEETEIATGKVEFDVHWSFTLGESRRITGLAIDKITYVKTAWAPIE